MGLAARQRSFQRALSVSAYNGMDWRLQKRKCLDIKGEGVGPGPQTRSLKAFKHPTSKPRRLKASSLGWPWSRSPESFQQPGAWI